MTDRPMIFGPAMVRALLAGRKTQTRRILRWQPDPPEPGYLSEVYQNAEGGWGQMMQDAPGGEVWCPLPLPARAGDLIWVKEAHRLPLSAEGPRGVTKHGPVFYEADQHWFLNQEAVPGKKRPSIHMPRWASRLTLTVTDVRVERLNAMSAADALAEGIQDLRTPDHSDFGIPGLVNAQHPVRAFWLLWETIHGDGAWEANPYVAALTFSVRRTPIDSLTPAERAA